MKQVLIALDQLCNTLLAGMADETLSARAHRTRNPIRHVINLIFFWDRVGNKQHCELAYESEQVRAQLPKAYRS